MSDTASALREQQAWVRHSLDRERSQARVFIALATVLVPGWIPFDYLLEPAAAPRILLLRLADVAVGLACLVALRRARTLRDVRVVALVKMVSTGVAIALMLPMVEQYFWPYVLGFSLLFWGSAVVFALPTRLLASAWILVLAVAVIGTAAGPARRTSEELVGAGFFIVSMLVICTAQSALRSRLERSAFLSTHRLAEASRRVLESEALKTQLFANVSHELRTPLALILGPAEQLLGEPALAGEHRRQLSIITRNARLLLGRVNDLLDVARLEFGQLDLHYASTDLAQLVRTVANDFEGTARERGLTLAVEAPASVPAEVDPDKIQAVLLNLLSNALKVTPSGGRIRCTLALAGADRDEPRALLEVADSGPGVPAAHRAVIFDRFRQIEGGPARTIGGTGLGLAITKEIVELHRGRIEVTDSVEGGASFRVEIPVRAPAEASVSEPSAGEPIADHDRTQLALAPLEVEQLEADDAPGEQPLVLVVEDNPDLNRFVRETLSPQCRTASALDGRAGLEKALALRPDLIVTDVMMPEMSGDQLVEAIRAHRELEDVPILVLSARADDALRVRLLRGGAQDYVTKPFLADELRARASNLVETARARGMLQADLETKEQSVASLAREVTERRRELTSALEAAQVARELAERASEIKSRFLRVVSHELRSPLSTLLLSIERLKHEPDLIADPAPIVSRMERAGNRLLDLIESLLEYARIEAGKLALRVEPVDLVELSREVIEELRPQADAKGLRLELCAPERVPPLETDERLVRLIVVNLMGNAVKFTVRGEVTLTLDAAAGAHRVAVRDTGPGIDPEQRARIFEPFEQLEAVRAKHSQGAGLGLALVREMVLALGGSIELDSAPGQGSTFIVRLPPAVSERPRIEDPHVQDSPARGG